MKSSAVLVALVPTGVVTVTSTVPAPDGEIAVIEVADTPTRRSRRRAEHDGVAAMNPVPVMVTEVPPAGGPPPGSRRDGRYGHEGVVVVDGCGAACHQVW